MERSHFNSDGEPLIRKDIGKIIKRLYDKGAKITVVTNGELLNKHYESLKYINRINLSIHSLDKKKYDDIVQKKEKLNKILSNIAIIKNMQPNIDIRLNSVVIKGQNDSIQDMKEYIDFAIKINASIKFVELFTDAEDEIVKLADVAIILKKLGFKHKNISNISKQVLTNGKIDIIISRIFCANAIDQHDPEDYCNKYNDLFITPEGYVNICRQNKDDIKIYSEIKDRNKSKLVEKINISLERIGKNCPLIKTDKVLAINGGPAIFKDMEEGKFIHPKITEEIKEAVLSQLEDTISIYDNSNVFQEFESSFKEYHGVEHALTFSSGTAALWGMYEGINLKQDDEVICPCYTFFATISPIFLTGAIPILVDCNSKGGIDVSKIEEKITPRTKAIVVTHMWGYVCEMDKLKKLANKYNLYLLEDCSHAHGASYNGKKVGSWGDAAAFSIQGNKIITGGEGRNINNK